MLFAIIISKTHSCVELRGFNRAIKADDDDDGGGGSGSDD